MLYLVEGLNSSGKTTWIENNKKIGDRHITTYYLNPLRWSRKKKELIQNGGIANYCLGCYEMLRTSLVNLPCDAYWDRTFISAWVYYTINEDMFEYLCKEYLSVNTKVIFIDTDPQICMSRFKKNRKRYVSNFDWYGLRDRFHEAISKMKRIGYDIKVIPNYGATQ